MSDPSTPDPAIRAARSAAARARRLTERLKLTATAIDRLSTVVLGGAVLAPFFQHQRMDIPESVAWFAGAVSLHAAAHVVLRFLPEGDIG